MARFAELANQKSKGELDVKVFYQSLGTEAGLTEQVVGGAVDMGTCAMGNLSRFTDAFLTLDLPFLFRSDGAVLEFLDKDPQGKKVLEKLEKDIVTGMSTNMILEPPAMIPGFLPSFMPLLGKVGVDVIHWGVLFCTNMGLGAIIPPVALNLFVATPLAGVRYEQAVRATVPFIIIMVADLIIMAAFPLIPLMPPHLLFDYPLP